MLVISYQGEGWIPTYLDIQFTITSLLGRRGRRTTRRVPHYKIDADSDEGSDNSTIDENYDVASISSSIEEGLT